LWKEKLLPDTRSPGCATRSRFKENTPSAIYPQSNSLFLNLGGRKVDILRVIPGSPTSTPVFLSSFFDRFIFNPDAFLGPGPELHIYYLFAYNYDQNTIDLAANDDGFIAAWRHTLDIKSGDEHTLRWYKLPVRWTTHRNPRTALKPKELQD
jgi:hypothetical protein